MPVPETFMIATATVAVASSVHSAVGTDLRPLSGYQSTQRGVQQLDRTQAILDSEVGRSEKWAIECELFTQRHQVLQQQRNKLLKQTETVVGSMMNWGAARDFHHQADELYEDTKASSDRRRGMDGRAEAHHRILDKRERDANGREQARTYPRPEGTDYQNRLMGERQLEQDRRVAEIKSFRDDTSKTKGRPARPNTNHEHGQPNLYYPSESSAFAQDKLNECLQPPYVAPASHYQNSLSYYPQAQLAPRPDPSQYRRY